MNALTIATACLRAFLALGASPAAPAPAADPVWVYFADDRPAPASIADTALTPRAVQRRAHRRTLPGLFDRNDVPLAAEHADAVASTGALVRTRSRWLHAVSALATPAQAKAQAERDVMLIDAALGFIAREMKEGRVKARISDIPALLRAKALLRGEATERVAVGGVHVVVGAETVRMRDAGDDPTARLQAMRSDVRDLSVILDHLESDDTAAVAASLDLPDAAAR